MPSLYIEPDLDNKTTRAVSTYPTGKVKPFRSTQYRSGGGSKLGISTLFQVVSGYLISVTEC